jgi:hypothetical protein
MAEPDPQEAASSPGSPAPSGRGPAALRARRRRGLVALARARLREATAGRIGRLAAVLVVLCFGIIAVALRVTDGGEAHLEGLVPSAARWIAWLAGAPLCFAAAADRRLSDRRDGIDALAAARGFSSASLESARALAAMMETARALAVPLAGLSLLVAALSGSARLLLVRAGLLIGALAFALIAGMTLGAVASACGRLGRARGRWLLVAVVLGPWVLADLAGHGAWSIPGALDAFLDFALRAGGASA